LKKLAVLFVVLVSAFAVTACGSSKNPVVTPDTLAAAMDGVCTDAQVDFESLGTRGTTNAQLALEFEGTQEVRQAVVDGLNELNLDDQAKKAIQPYIEASEKVVASDKAIAKAAAADDDAAVQQAFKQQNAAFNERDKAAKELGTKVCGQRVETEVVPTGTAPPADLDYAEPTNTIEEAADGYIKAFKDKDCAKVNENRHTDAGELTDQICNQVAVAFKNATVKGTEQYGPVGQAEIVAGGVNYPTFFVEDFDNILKYAGDTVNDQGGLRPAPEGNDAQESVDATFAAIRDNDAAAFDETLPDEDSGFNIKKDGEFDTFSDGKYNAPFVKDVRAGDENPIQLGLNSTWGFYYYPGSKNDWVVTAVHIPGLGGHYRFSGYWPVPKP